METFPVILEPVEHTLITPMVTTRVVEIPFKLGDSFHKGDLLIKFENDLFKANLVKARKILIKALEDLKVKTALQKDHLMSEMEVLDAEANVSIAEADYVSAKDNFNESEIRAPYDGKVSAVAIHLYELPARDKPILEIFNDKKLIANFLVPSHYLKVVHVGDPVYIHINDTHEIVTAIIKRFSPNVNAASGTIKIEAEIDNRNGHIKSGMQSEAAFNREAFEEKEGSFGKIMEELKKEEQPSQAPKQDTK